MPVENKEGHDDDQCPPEQTPAALENNQNGNGPHDGPVERRQARCRNNIRIKENDIKTQGDACGGQQGIIPGQAFSGTRPGRRNKQGHQPHDETEKNRHVLLDPDRSSKIEKDIEDCDDPVYGNANEHHPLDNADHPSMSSETWRCALFVGQANPREYWIKKYLAKTLRRKVI